MQLCNHENERSPELPSVLADLSLDYSVEITMMLDVKIYGHCSPFYTLNKGPF